MMCETCGSPLPEQHRGRPRKYCSNLCQKRAHPRARCAVAGCYRLTQHRCEGMCKAHYSKSIERQPAWTMRDEVVDFLGLEGWATAHEIADRFDRNVDSVYRVLRELRSEELVECRVVELALASTWGLPDKRTEWRLT